MKTQKDIQVLIDAYRAAAYRQGHAKTTRAKNAASDKIFRIYDELRHRDARLRLLPLLMDTDDSVRCWAAAHALEFAPEKGLPVLVELSNGPPGEVRATASITLDLWRAGKLKFP